MNTEKNKYYNIVLPHLWLGVRRTFVEAKNNMYFLSENGVIKG